MTAGFTGALPFWSNCQGQQVWAARQARGLKAASLAPQPEQGFYCQLNLPAGNHPILIISNLILIISSFNLTFLNNFV
jgi:hypothetical protein